MANEETKEQATQSQEELETAKELDLLKEYSEINAELKSKEERKKYLNKELKGIYGDRLVRQICAKSNEELTDDDKRILNSSNPAEEALKLNKVAYTLGNISVTCSSQDKSKINEDRTIAYIEGRVADAEGDLDIMSLERFGKHRTELTDEEAVAFNAMGDVDVLIRKLNAFNNCIQLVKKTSEDAISICLDEGYIIPKEFKANCIDEVLTPTLTVRVKKSDPKEAGADL